MSLIDDYIARFPEHTRGLMEEMRRAIREEAPESVETMSYGIPTFDVNGSHLVHFAAYARHVGFYPGASSLVTFREELSGYKSAKGSVQFPLDRPLPLDIVRRIVRFRLAEPARRARRKQTGPR